MIYLDIETVPDQNAIASDAWHRFKQKHGLQDDAAATHPAFGRVVCYAAYCTSISRWSVIGGTTDRGGVEKDVLSTLSGLLKEDKQICGHNIKGFDIPFLACRYLANGMPLPQPLIVAGKKPWEIQHIDTMELLRFGGGKRISLDAACLMLGVPSPKIGRVTSDSVWDAYRNGDMPGICDLCQGDVEALIHVHRKIEAAQRPVALSGRPAA